MRDLIQGSFETSALSHSHIISYAYTVACARRAKMIYYANYSSHAA
jgi:hypothetical protein